MYATAAHCQPALSGAPRQPPKGEFAEGKSHFAITYYYIKVISPNCKLEDFIKK